MHTQAEYECASSCAIENNILIQYNYNKMYLLYK